MSLYVICRVRDCEFGDIMMMMPREIFLIGIVIDHLNDQLLTEDARMLTFDSMVAKIETFERAWG